MKTLLTLFALFFSSCSGRQSDRPHDVGVGPSALTWTDDCNDNPGTSDYRFLRGHHRQKTLKKQEKFPSSTQSTGEDG